MGTYVADVGYFNPSKCQSPRGDRPVQYDYTLHGHVLEQVSTANYIGLNLHEQLSWNFHTDVTAKKANRDQIIHRQECSLLSQEG